MGKREAVREDDARPRRARKVVAGLLGVALLAGGGVAWRTGTAEEWWHDLRGDGAEQPADPAAVAPPPEVDVPDVVRPKALARPAAGAGALDRAAIAAALRPLADKDLGKHVLAAVGPLDGTAISYRATEGASVAMPASTTKLVTSAVALFLLGPDRTFDTTTVLDTSGPTPRLVLVGGGDPFLTRTPAAAGDASSPTYEPHRADIRTLARSTARALRTDGVRTVQLGYDDSLFSGPDFSPRWRPDYFPSEVAPISALWVDEARTPDGSTKVTNPAPTAAAEFRKELVRAGIRVAGGTLHGRAAATSTPVAEVTSPTVAQIVQRLIEVSDNNAAEVLLRQIGLADQGTGSFEAGQAAVERVLAANGIDLGSSVLYDGSGLSRDNRLSPDVLVEVLRWAASDDHPQLRPLLAALPVAGYTGSLANRMDHGPAAGRGRVRAKTGTLTGVSSLAGIAVDREGNLMVFALMADRVRPDRSGLARTAMDDAAAGLGACSCGR
ncbi:D-alanyl-D-alanine carboxypeptidase/D-alanyl-D-alanine-endopeptidase (penicillin-binding protein 4) [Nocardioides aromaticivorans]|uniref:D-alanyl-D-alanine carboxypeptidase/D-alanyl-D-alanine-endopeptidase (Penicillin-binding protein 4) n=1 Tax=Nocardioides aromaticivorans TaxID=200618 RepID=A0A7Y9ZHD8_9ACTN|nr:D-alanyl-D-alanine carboxypeptidase/D-alanyl-D-alanine-endopeptidase [Nocardioides aromaticivorans]NYI45457.1 D-alanyl-D-alanine carboxypeptidase/D-alanyl-D-alanine-endopeptidase (penicillin-binding protein 4) [Nocardioides aromaticivorans]